MHYEASLIFVFQLFEQFYEFNEDNSKSQMEFMDAMWSESLSFIEGILEQAPRHQLGLLTIAYYMARHKASSIISQLKLSSGQTFLSYIVARMQQQLNQSERHNVKTLLFLVEELVIDLNDCYGKETICKLALDLLE